MYLRDRTGPAPFVKSFVPMGRDFIRISKKLQTPMILLDSVNRSIEIGDLAVW